MMLTSMAIVMLVSMRSMFPDKSKNMVIGAVAAVVFILSFAGMRTQAIIELKSKGAPWSLDLFQGIAIHPLSRPVSCF